MVDALMASLTASPPPSAPHRLLELNPGPKIAEQVRGVLATCEKSLTDAVKIKYDPRNPFDICSSTFSAIYKVSMDGTEDAPKECGRKGGGGLSTRW